jgi:hypothetical protein
MSMLQAHPQCFLSLEDVSSHKCPALCSCLLPQGRHDTWVHGACGRQAAHCVCLLQQLLLLLLLLLLRCLQLSQVLLLLPVPLLPPHIFHIDRVRQHLGMLLLLLLLQVWAHTSCCRTLSSARMLPLLMSATARPRFRSTAAAAWRARRMLLHAARIQELWLRCCHVDS